MILLKTDGKCGINIFFPFFIKKCNGELLVVDWLQYRKFVFVYSSFNIFLCVVLIFLLFNFRLFFFDELYEFATFVQFSYVILRIKFGRRILKISESNHIIEEVAPVIVWIDYFTLGLMFVLTGSIGRIRASLDSELSMQIIFGAMQIVFSLYAILPFINYLSFKNKKNKLDGFKR